MLYRCLPIATIAAAGFALAYALVNALVLQSAVVPISRALTGG